jgi:hypothetical protein
METVTLKSKAEDGQTLSATFAPGLGMNLLSYRKGHIEVIDQNTREEFEKRFAGLGALIGPHFYRRKPHSIKPLADSSLFPHIAYTQERGDPDPFTHGIGRYAPWTFQATEDSVKAELKGTDKWNGIALSELEGQNFTMRFSAKLDAQGLHLELSVVSETASLVGTHYYYSLPKGAGTVRSTIKHKYYDPHELREVPREWLSKEHHLDFDLKNACDYAFHPHPHPREAEIYLDAIDHRLKIAYSCVSQENAWQLYHPVGASFVCIEPCSAQDPRHANLTVSSIKIRISID